MKKIRVVVVDDSAFSRRTITKMLDGFEGIEVVGYATNGEEGIQKVIALKPDLVTLDLEMPKMDGFTLLRILTSRFSLPVIVISAVSSAEKVFKALELGAFDFIVKPTSAASTDLLFIQDDLRTKVLQAAQLKMNSSRCSHEPNAESSAAPELLAPPHVIQTASDQQLIELVAIGASTGGPPALQSIFSAFDRPFPFAIVVSQHMPPGFTRAFAERLNRSTGFTVKEAADGDPVLPGHILIAPGGKNLVFEIHRGQVTARIVPPTAADRYIPSVDVMFESCASFYRNRMVAVILTGMGNDGSKGLLSVKEQGGFIISESEESAVVYGMPREAAATGLVDRVVPLDRVAREILLRGGFA
jgi:two-component system, chemotaxis family, protein-glutamate methylesterase/glutaminase